MPDYPDYGQRTEDTIIEPDAGLIVDRSISGKAHIRAPYTETQYNITVTHPALTQTQRDALLAIFDSDPLTAITFTYVPPPPLLTERYSCNFVERPVSVPTTAGIWFVISQLTGSKL